MPSSSMRLTSAASEKRGGGSVKCCAASIALLGERLAFRSSRAGGLRSSSSSDAVVLAFLVEREKAVELHDRAGGAQFDRARARPWRRCRPVVRSSSADSIWLATARFQINS